MIQAMERVEISLLGRFEVDIDGMPVHPAAWKPGRARDLVKLLSLAPGDHATMPRPTDAANRSQRSRG